MSDWLIPGGKVSKGSRAQEEELFRRSNYFKHLHQEYYPINPESFDTIISHNVEFFRCGKDKGYVLMDEPIEFDCIASPALRFPQVNSSYDDFGRQEDRTYMENKIRMLLYTAAKNGNDSIILSAWGCGAYGCPPQAMAQLFKNVLDEFVGVFKETPFAILDINYLYFRNEFNPDTKIDFEPKLDPNAFVFTKITKTGST
jgi:uncharacterized protein (TIGR02452 family)